MTMDKGFTGSRRMRLAALALAAGLVLSCLPQNALCALAASAPALIDSYTDTGLCDTRFYTDSKPALEALTASFPQTLPALTDRGSQTEIPVTWTAAGDDYETSASRYFQFVPVPAEGYELPADYDVILEAPYIAVFVNLAVDETADQITDKNTASSSVVFSEEADTESADSVDTFFESYDSVSGDDLNIFAGTAVTSEDACEEAVFDAASSVVKGENAAACFKFFTNEMLLSSAAACGIMANIMAESSFRPDALGDNGTSYGICQWHDDTKRGYTRWSDLKSYCKKNGLDWHTLDGQLEYLNYEAEKDYPKTMARMRSVSNDAAGAWDAADCWCRNYEVPANKIEVGKTRGNLAMNTFWPAYGIVAADGTDITVMAGRKLQIADLCFDGLDIQADRYRIVKKYQKYATISKKGKLTAKKKGTAVVEAQQAFTNSAGKTVYVTVARAKVNVIKKPALKIAKMTDPAKQTDIYECFSTDLAGIKPDMIKSKNTSVITVSEDGKLTALKNGKSKITVYFGTPGEAGTVAVSATVKVKFPAQTEQTAK